MAQIPTQDDFFKQMSPEQKLRLFLDLHECAWNLKAAGLRFQHPDWTEEQIQNKVKEIFLYART
ncbi:MAG: hypothetical protein ACTSRA_13540 [Promethearchaeota archaeon]